MKSGLAWTPGNPVADLAPGDSISCTATHTIVQADLDAGHYANTACVDDGAGNAEKACASKDVPGSKTPHLTITKKADRASYDAVGQVITYTIVATNDGNVPLHNVLVSDPSVSGLTCTPSNPVADLAPGESISCTATHTIVQADLDAGHYANTACVDDGEGGADKACASKDVPGSKTPHLTISKVATETTYSKVGDVIHYTIVAKNDGNVTLTNVTVTDAQVSNLTCTPSNPVASLAPNGTINCTASHTISQADLDAGSFFNKACVDDGANGADQQCADVTTPGTQTPHLTISKVATETTYSKVGDVIHYTIVAKNDGNVTLTNVTVTDAQVSNLTCTPSNPVASLAPGGTINCTASHTIGQADLDAGSFFNKACVDDGAGPAGEACADVTTTGTQNPHRKITKVATETTYSAIGDVIHYTIVATNDGNVTLHNVLVTDPNASNLTCTPSVPVASLAPNGTINCTANHTIVQADIDATHYLNQACVDDGTGGAAQACASVNTPATLTASQITPTQTTCQQFSAGTSSTLSALSYSVKSGAVSQVAPGVFFYWVKVTATAGANTFTIGQTS